MVQMSRATRGIPESANEMRWATLGTPELETRVVIGGITQA